MNLNTWKTRNPIKKFLPIASMVLIAALILISVQLHGQDTSVSEEVKMQIKMLQSGSPKEKISAARHLGGMGAEAIPSVPYLIELLDSSEKNRSVLNKVWNIVNIFSSSSRYVSYESQKALVRIGKPAVIQLSNALMSHPRTGVRRRVAIILGEIKDVESVDSLITALRTDEAYKVRMHSAEALGKMADKWSLDLLGNAELALIEALKDEDPNVREYSVDALGEMKDMQAVPALIETLKQFGKDSGADRALYRITRKQFGNDPEKWQEWWDKNKKE